MTTYETKSTGAPVEGELTPDYKSAIDNVNRTLVQVQQMLERKAAPDGLDQEKIDRATLDAAEQAQLAQLAARKAAAKAGLYELKMRGFRPGGEAASENDNEPDPANDNIEHKSHWLNWVRKGEEVELRNFERKNFISTEQAQTAGFLLPTEIADLMDVELRLYSPVRQYARTVKISGSSLRIPIKRLGQKARWTNSERDTPVTQPTDKFAELEIRAEQIEAQAELTRVMMEDSVINLEEWIANSVAEQFAVEEGLAFVSGSGVGQPQGFLSYRNTPNSSDGTVDSIGVIKTGANGAFLSATAGQSLETLTKVFAAIKPQYREGSCWFMNRRTLAHIMQLRDAEGRQLYNPQSVNAGMIGTLLNYPICDLEHMPDHSTTGAFAIVFGDLSRAYTIVEREDMYTLRDPYSVKPLTQFTFYRRCGGQVTTPEALKFIQFSA